MSNWYKQSQQKQQSGLSVVVEKANSYGEIRLLINGQAYEYSLPWGANEIGQKITDLGRKGWGKQLKREIDKLDRYRVQ